VKGSNNNRILDLYPLFKDPKLCSVLRHDIKQKALPIEEFDVDSFEVLKLCYVERKNQI
jgi:hypothetical protein